MIKIEDEKTAKSICEYLDVSYDRRTQVTFDVCERDDPKLADGEYSLLKISQPRTGRKMGQQINIVSHFGGRTEVLFQGPAGTRHYDLSGNEMTVKQYRKLNSGKKKLQGPNLTYSVDNAFGWEIVDTWHTITGRAVREAINYGRPDRPQKPPENYTICLV